MFDGRACLGRTAALCRWGGFPAAWASPSCSQDTCETCNGCSLHHYILSNLWLYYLLFPSPTLSLFLHTHTHTRFSLSFVKDKGALPRVPPPTLSHVISVLTHSNICSIKTSSHTVLISYWQREVNVPILLCFN